MKCGKRKTWEILWYICIFTFMYIWFSQIHPLVVYDADDWTYISYTRNAVPTLNEWNPSRIFPEVFMPFCGGIAAYVVAPLIGDYVLSFTYVSAAVVSLFISFYVYCFGSYIRQLLDLENYECRCIELLFLILHFVVFVIGYRASEYLFRCHNLTCYYYYLIPGLMNASIVMIMESGKGVFAEAGLAKKSLWVLIAYIAVFSNLVVSSIVVVYAGVAILKAYNQCAKSNERLSLIVREFICKSIYHLYIVGLWCMSAVYELFGLRAASAAQLGNSYAFLPGLKQAMIHLYNYAYDWNPSFWITSIVIVIVAVLLLIMSGLKNEIDKVFLRTQSMWVCTAILVLVYTLLLSAKVNADVVTRPEYLYSAFFFGLLILMIGAGYILKKAPRTIILLPLLLFIVASYTQTKHLPIYKESNVVNMSPRICLEISRNLVEQVVQADKLAKDEVELNVVDYATDDNWPHAVYLGDRLAGTLYKHGVVSKHMKIVINQDRAMNDEFGVAYPD